MFIFKTKAQVVTPDAEGIKDEPAREFAKQVIRILRDEFRAVVDDLKAVERAERVDTLPSVTSDNVGKFYLLNGTGAASDKLYMCVDTGASGYGLKEVTLT